MRTCLLVVSAVLLLSGCVTARPTAFEVPKERGTECLDICTGLGMKLGAVVVIMNSAGCVCEPAGATGAVTSGSAAAAGGAAIAAAQAAARQQQAAAASQHH